MAAKTNKILLLAAEHPIKLVTVFKSSKAEVVRTFTVDAQEGTNWVSVTGLPSVIDTKSIRISGLPSTARLADVVCTTNDNVNNHGFSASESKNTDPRLKQLLAKKKHLGGLKEIYQHEQSVLSNYSKTLTGEHVNPETMNDFLRAFVDTSRKNLELTAQVETELEEIEREVSVLQKDIEKGKGLKKGQSTGEVGIGISVLKGGAGKLEFNLTYIVSSASWAPAYELHAKTDAGGKPSPSLSLRYRARVTQSTGEDWTGTSLTLSTVALDTHAKSVPRLNPIRIKLSTPSLFGPRNNGGIFMQQKPAFNNANNPGGLFGQPARPQQAFGQQQQQAAFGAAPQAPSHGGFGAFGQGTQATGSAGTNTHTSAFGASTFGSAFGSSANPGAGLFGSAGTTTSLFGAPSQASSTGAPMQAPTMQTHSAPVQQPSQGFDLGGDTFEEIDVPASETLQPNQEEEIGFATPLTLIAQTPLAISYAVDGASNIPSDGVPHQVEIAVLPFEGKISHILVPRVDRRVYLQCQVKNTSDYRLFPGPVSVILDDSFVSSTVIQDINTGDTFNCTLGDSTSVIVTYSRVSKVSKAAGGAFTETMNTTTFNTKVVVHNKHQFNIDNLVVKEIIPTSDDSRVKVILRKPDGLADAKTKQIADGEDGKKVGWAWEKDGKFDWAWKVDAGAKVTFEAEWDVRAPSDLHLTEGSA